MTSPVTVPLGSDRFRAQLIAEACRAEGIKVEVLFGDDSGFNPHLGLLQGHRLLVAPADVERVEAIIESAE